MTMTEEQDWKGLSILDKIEHKNWKARLEGYDGALKEMNKSDNPKDPLFNPYLGLIKNMVNDNNAVAQEKALEVVLTFVQEANIAQKAVNDICPGIVNKCFISNRQKTKECGYEILKTIVEIEKHDVVMDELLKGLNGKTPKIVVGSIVVLKECLHEFGIAPKIVPIKEVFKVVPKLLEDRDKNVREAGKDLIIEIYRWLGEPALKTVLSQLKPVQVTELTTEFEKISEKPSPTRYLRSQKPKEGSAMKPTGGGDSISNQNGAEAVAKVDIDPYEFLEPIEVISKIPSNFYEKLDEKKWTDRKEALEVVEGLTNHEKLVPGEYGELLKALLKVVAKDTNIVLVALAAKIIHQIAHGLRQKYSPYATNTIQVCLEKFKEKKANVVKALRDAVDSAFSATTLEACIEDIEKALDHKTPSVKSETSLFLNRYFEKPTTKPPTKKLLNQLMTGLTKLCLESTPEVRDASFQTLGTMMKVIPEKAMKPHLESIDPVKMARINEFYEKAKAAATVPTTPSQPVSVSVTSTATKQPEPIKSEKPSDEKKTGTAPKPVAKKAAAKPSKPTVNQSKEPEIPVEPVLSDDDVTNKATEIFGAELLNQIVDKNWKERSTGLEKLQEYVKQCEPANIPCQLIIRLLLLKPGLKDNNVQVIKFKIELIKELVMKGKMTWTTVEMCIGDLTEKIGDIKNSENVKNTLTEMCDVINLQLVGSQVIKTATENVNVKNLTEALNWLNEAIKDFGFRIAMADVLPFIKVAVQHTSPIIRQSGIKLAGTISLYVREVISTLLKDEKASIKQLIDQEIESQKSVNPPAPTRGLKNLPVNNVQEADGVSAPVVPELNIEEMIPRENISNKISETLLTQLADKAIKIKREALEEATKIVNAHSGILAEGLQNFVTVIAKNASDSSSIISKMAIGILVSICNGFTRKDAERFVKIVIPALIASLNDPKPKNREDAIAALNVWTEKVGFPAIVDGGVISDAVKQEKPFLKDAIFSWISPHLTKLAESKSTKKVASLLYPEFPAEMLPILYLAVEDRNKEVRESAKEAVLPFMLVFGYDTMLKHRKNTSKTVAKDNILPLLEKAKAELPVPEPVVSKQPSKIAASNEKLPQQPKESSTKKPVESKSKKDDSKKNSKSTKPGESDKDSVVISLLSKSSNKKQRILEDRKKKITRWEPSSMNVQQLNTHFSANCSPELFGLLFSNDLKKFIKAIDLMNNFLSEDDKDSMDATKQNLDLILKWMVLRFNETNPSVLIKGLEYLTKIFTIFCQDSSFQLSEQEALSFIPDLILKLGDSKDAVRSSSQRILKMLCNCFDNIKILQVLEENFSNKLTRVSQESADFVKWMIDERKIEVLSQKPLLKSLGTLANSGVANVRNAALNCLVSAHNFIGEDLFNIIDTLSDPSKLNERIKRTGKPVSSETENSTQSIIPIEKNQKSGSRQPESSTAHKDQTKSQTAQAPKPQMIDVNPLLNVEISYKLINVDREMEELSQPLDKITLRYSGRASQTVNSNDAITSVIHAINSTDVQTSIQAMAQIDEVIRNQDVRSQLVSYMDNLVMSITMQLKSTLGKLSEEKFSESEITDMFKGMLATLVSIFNAKELACELNRERLMNLMQSILRIVINDQLVSLSEGGTIIRGINILSVRILESSNQTRMLSALLRMMSDCLKNGDITSKYLNLIFKCIWSMTKNLINTVNSIDLVIILKDIHTFYSDFPPHVWESRDGGRDVPLRTIKTLVYSIINNKCGGVLEALHQMSSTPNKELDFYIRKSYAKLNVPIPSVLPQPLPTLSDPAKFVEQQLLVDKSKSSVQSNSRPYLDELKEIFSKIGNPSKNKQGLNDLYDFKTKYPYMDLSRYLAQTTPYFQRTIETGLKGIAEERGQAPISVFSSNQLNNNGASSALEKDPPVNYCDMEPEALLDRLKQLRVNAGLDKFQPVVDKIDPGLLTPMRDDMETSVLSKLAGSGDGPAGPRQINQTNKRKMSATDLAALKQRMEALKRPN